MAQQHLIQALENVDRQLQDITSSPKPSYSLNGKSISWGEHFNNLLKSRDELARLILQADGAFEVQAINNPGTW